MPVQRPLKFETRHQNGTITQVPSLFGWDTTLEDLKNPAVRETYLLAVFDKWLLDASDVIQEASGKTYERLQSSALGLSGLHDGSCYFSHLSLHEKGKNRPTVIFESVQIDKSDPAAAPRSQYIYNKAANWFRESSGSLKLAIIACLSQEDPVAPWGAPSALTSTSKSCDWGLSAQEIVSWPLDSIIAHIHYLDLQQSTSRTDLDIYCLTSSYRSHQGYAERVFHASFLPGGELARFVEFASSDFSLSRVFPELRTTRVNDQVAEKLRVPASALHLLHPQALREDRFAQAQNVARAAKRRVTG
ncbi:hypothetical protein TSTA_124880 [Talaromyces stipitatus ATCC 10500]|uniref:Uncharacterized protein n=1 Tax=Talaromyces stipitatus (strain ATCC 10500 / CBS 375.48 / QM 6759 / NRRL 1006) TaxID=441959 RepID=B8MCF3_TALSN|nr:uncharacterized protein TSTA_124880 [Talaromyces stipitatus ATCC 10500]EED18769.1 hypothetical protein TSTA_124880 [Talaromyces stipitatus ATCC 10500]